MSPPASECYSSPGKIVGVEAHGESHRDAILMFGLHESRQPAGRSRIRF